MLGSSVARTDLSFFSCRKVETTVLVVETPDPVVTYIIPISRV